MAAGGTKTNSQIDQGVITRGSGQCLPAATSKALNPRARSHSQATWRHLGSCIEGEGSEGGDQASIPFGGLESRVVGRSTPIGQGRHLDGQQSCFFWIAALPGGLQSAGMSILDTINPSLTRYRRDEPAPVLPLRDEPDLLSLLEASGRLVADEETASTDVSTVEEEELSALMGEKEEYTQTDDQPDEAWED